MINKYFAALLYPFLDHQRRYKNTRFVLLLFALSGFLASWRPVSWLASGTLEWWYPPSVVPDGDAEVIVVLSGSNTQARYERAAWLHTHWRALPVLASVWRGHPLTVANTCSTLAQRVLKQNG